MADWTDDGIIVTGGAVYKPDDGDGDIWLKCPQCYHKDKVLRHYRATDVYSRTVGYLRPVGAWNGAKQQEHKLRVNFSTPGQQELASVA